VATDLAEHPYFERWEDPDSGVLSFLLRERVAAVQQSFYFVNSSLSGDEKWLWFHAGFPPSPHRMLAAASMDPEHPDIRLFPETAGARAPMIAPEGDAVYYCSGPSVWRKHIAADPECICTLSDDYIAGRRLDRLATHLTLSADGKYFLLDGAIGNHWFVALGDRESGRTNVLHEFPRHYNHGQFSPVDPSLFLIAQDWWNDPVSGRHFELNQRTWLMDIGQRRFEPVAGNLWFGHNSRCSHEWWSSDGFICWTDYEKGAFECDLTDRRPQLVWKGPLCHTHCDRTRRFWCADESPYKWTEKPCQILLFDRETQRQISIVTGMPPPPVPRRMYHLDPHPQFSPLGSFVVYTTMVRGQVDIALSPVEGILDRMPPNE
jgi:hypothetical protein